MSIPIDFLAPAATPLLIAFTAWAILSAASAIALAAIRRWEK